MVVAAPLGDRAARFTNGLVSKQQLQAESLLKRYADWALPGRRFRVVHVTDYTNEKPHVNGSAKPRWGQTIIRGEYDKYRRNNQL